MTRLTMILLAALVAVTAGCGGSSRPVPDVTGERLDVAKSDMQDAGYDTEEVGGGLFGVVEEANWTVCETRPAAGSTDSGKVKLIVDRSCPDTAPAAAQDSASGSATQATHKRKRHHKPTQASAQPAAQRVTVPGVVGMDHQAAQNRMQAAGLYNLREVDGTGQGRLLLWDRNWTVIAQKPAPGTSVREGAKITLVSVKDDER